MKLFKTLKAAVFHVIDHSSIGHRSSLEDLAIKAIQHLDWDYTPRCGGLDYSIYKYGELNEDEQKTLRNAVCVARQQWRKANKKKATDCRKYTGQPRRNQRNDRKAKITALKKLSGVVEQVGEKVLLEALKEFHSIDQIRVAITHTVELSPYFDLGDM